MKNNQNPAPTVAAVEAGNDRNHWEADPKISISLSNDFYYMLVECLRTLGAEWQRTTGGENV